MEIKTAADCIHCHKCRNNCSFLSKYGIDIGDTDKLRELAYHCFLCGTCTSVCPIHIDGRGTIIEMRRERAASDERSKIEKTYKGLIAEKRNYRYRNWRHAGSGAVFFPGCNFPSLYPKTAAAASKLLAEHGIGTVYECCGKPIAELGLADDEERILSDIRKRLNDNNITEIVTACPNCRNFFGDRLGVKITGIFEKLSELGLGKALDGDFTIYVPCPDRTENLWIDEIRKFVKGDIKFVEGVQCCGLGGSAGVCEPEMASGFTDRISAKAEGKMATYCASCMGQFSRKGFKSIDHLLPLVLGTGEKPDIMKSYVNRMLTKIK